MLFVVCFMRCKMKVDSMKILTRHLEEVNETYVEHFGHAMGFALKMLIGAIACAVHAIVPFAFERTGSKMIAELYDCMVTSRAELSTREQRNPSSRRDSRKQAVG